MITVMKFYATWCRPCAILSETLSDVEGIEEVDISIEQEKAAQYHVRKVPTLIFLKDDVEVHRSTGLITRKNYDAILEEINDSKELNIKVVDPEILKTDNKE